MKFTVLNSKTNRHQYAISNNAATILPLFYIILHSFYYINSILFYSRAYNLLTMNLTVNHHIDEKNGKLALNPIKELKNITGQRIKHSIHEESLLKQVM